MLRTKSPTAWLEFERGETDEATHLPARSWTAHLRRAWLAREAMAAGYAWLPGMEALLGALQSAGVEMHALSNYPVWYERLEARLGVSRYLSWRFVSCRTGVRKPAPLALLGAARGLRRRAPDVPLRGRPRGERSRCAGRGAGRVRVYSFNNSQETWKRNFNARESFNYNAPFTRSPIQFPKVSLDLTFQNTFRTFSSFNSTQF